MRGAGRCNARNLETGLPVGLLQAAAGCGRRCSGLAGDLPISTRNVTFGQPSSQIDVWRCRGRLVQLLGQRQLLRAMCDPSMTGVRQCCKEAWSLQYPPRPVRPLGPLGPFLPATESLACVHSEGTPYLAVSIGVQFPGADLDPHFYEATGGCGPEPWPLWERRRWATSLRFAQDVEDPHALRLTSWNGLLACYVCCVGLGWTESSGVCLLAMLAPCR